MCDFIPAGGEAQPRRQKEFKKYFPGRAEPFRTSDGTAEALATWLSVNATDSC